nr:DUF2189 domain-containing protein [Hoeflea marina]
MNGPAAGAPALRRATFADIGAALAQGWSDFRAFPLFGVFFGGIFAFGGLFIFVVLKLYGAPWMVIPLAIGFPLLGPFVAVGIYEVSRRRMAGQPVTWSAVLLRVFDQRERQLGWMAFVVLFIFWIWVYQVRLLLALFLGFRMPHSLDGFVTVIASTPEGLGFIVVGTLVGAALSAVLFSTTVFALPMLMEREIDFVTAMVTSVAAVMKAPLPMLLFGSVIGAATLSALLPLFLGLVVVLPVMGHATWRLYAMLSRPG